MLKIGDKIKITCEEYLEVEPHLEGLVGEVIPSDPLTYEGEFLAKFPDDETEWGNEWYVRPEEVEVIENA